MQDRVSFQVYFNWFLLSFLAGNINSGGYLACHRFVSHVTGFATLAGIEFEKNNWLDALGTLLVPAFFLVGVIFSGYLTEKRYAHKVQGQKFAPVFGVIAVLLAIVAVGGYLGWFGQFGDPVRMEHDFILLACLCAACGLQNAAITSASGYTIRTTHLTGLTTDLGLGIVKVLFKSNSAHEKQAERMANYLRMGTILSFLFGSFIGAVIFVQNQYIGFLFPMVVALYFAFIAQHPEN